MVASQITYRFFLNRFAFAGRSVHPRHQSERCLVFSTRAFIPREFPRADRLEFEPDRANSPPRFKPGRARQISRAPSRLSFRVALEDPVGQDARQECDQWGVAADGVAHARADTVQRQSAKSHHGLGSPTHLAAACPLAMYTWRRGIVSPR